MSHYRGDRRHAEFLLFDVLGADETYGKGLYADADEAVARDVLAHAERFAVERLAPSFAAGDRQPLRLDPASGTVSLPPDLRAAISEHLRSDLLMLDLPAELSGHHMPPSLRWAATEFVLGANPAVAMCTQLVPPVVTLLHQAGTPEQRRLAELILARHWGVTMVLTEPDAGSDVGAARTRAHLQPDGSWHLSGTKRFITWAEHDAVENVVHMVLARPTGVAGAGGPGTKGLSLFVVPARHVDLETGAVGGRNGVRVTALERKMGITGTPTCELVFGADAPAVGTLLGEAHDGIRQMFEIITYVRTLVGLKAAAALSTGHLNARDYAASRVQGHAMTTLTTSGRYQVEIVQHPDVRRSLLTQRAYAEGARALVLYTATMLDRVEAAAAAGESDPAAWARHRLLLPLVKGWCSETAWRVLGTECLQVFGGSGYLKDYPLEQYVRDTKIDTIYEGTTGIQALDLLTRRVVRDGGATLRSLLDDVRATARGGDGVRLLAERRLLDEAVTALERMLAAIVGRADEAPKIAALGATRLLMSVGDVVVGWLLLRAADVAARRLDGEERFAGEESELRGRLAAGRWFARQVLPHVTTEAACAELLDGDPLWLPVESL